MQSCRVPTRINECRAPLGAPPSRPSPHSVLSAPQSALCCVAGFSADAGYARLASLYTYIYGDGIRSDSSLSISTAW